MPTQQSIDGGPVADDLHGVLFGDVPDGPDREAALDLRTHCPVCGSAYLAGDGVLALACLSIAAKPAPVPVTAAGTMTLGHQECVLPRLLTLLAGFQAETRFVKASKVFAADEFVFPEYRHDER